MNDRYIELTRNLEPTLQDRYSWSFYDSQWYAVIDALEEILQNENELSKDDILNEMQKVVDVNNGLMYKVSML